MKQILERPFNFDELNNLDLRSMFENTEDEPMIFTHLKAEGYVGNRPLVFEGEHEDDTWAIDQYDEDKEYVIESFLYTSRFEYEQDCAILGIPFFENISIKDFNSLCGANLTSKDDYFSIAEKIEDMTKSYFYVSMDGDDILESIENEKEIAEMLKLRLLEIEGKDVYIAVY